MRCINGQLSSLCTVGFAPGFCTQFLGVFGCRQGCCVEGAISAVYAPDTTPTFTAVTNTHTHTNESTEDATKVAIAAPT